MKSVFILLGIAVGILVLGGLYLQFSKPEDKFTFASEKQSQTQMMDEKIEFKNYGTAPEFTGIEKWLNSGPLTMQNLRGKVVLVDFWTYSCINCIRTLPYVTSWYETYKDQGLVVVGVHTPEFDFEKVTANVETAIRRHKINYPVAQDNNYATWQAYNNRFWPAEYLVDQEGNVVYVHFGEGNYDVTEKAIRTLLGLEGEPLAKNPVRNGEVKTPEIYFGLDRLQFLVNGEEPSSQPQNYNLPDTVPLNTFALGGEWIFDGEKATTVQAQAHVKLRFHAGKVFMVAQSSEPNKVRVMVDGKKVGEVLVEASQLYTLFDSGDYQDHDLDLIIENPGFEAFTFTFG